MHEVLGIFWAQKNQLGIPNRLTPKKSHPKSSIKDLLHPFWERPCWSQSRTISFPESPTKTQPNLWCFRFLWGSSHFLKGYGMIRPMFMLEEKMIPNNLANIPSMSVFQDGASQFFGNKHQDIHWHLGFYKIVVLMVSGKGVRKCVFYQSHFILILATPNPSMESNTTSLYQELAVANLVQRDPKRMGELDNYHNGIRSFWTTTMSWCTLPMLLLRPAYCSGIQPPIILITSTYTPKASYGTSKWWFSTQISFSRSW